MATKKKTSKKKTEEPEALERRFPMASAAEWRELVGDTSNVLTFSLPARGSRRPRGSGDGKKEK